MQYLCPTLPLHCFCTRITGKKSLWHSIRERMGKARRSKGTQRQQRRAFATDSLPGTDADAVEDDNTEVSLNHLNASLFGTTNQEPGKGSGGSRLKVVDDVREIQVVEVVKHRSSSWF